MESAEVLMEALMQEAKTFAPVKVYKRNEYIIREGAMENNIYLVESGCVRIFYLSEIEEHSIRFGYKGSLLNSLNSFVNRTPSEFYIQAIRRSELRVISRSDFEAFLGKSEKRIEMYGKLLEKVISEQLAREVDLLTYSPYDRLKRVEKRSPQLFQEVPSKYIASYLRMTPETLSRLRKS